MDMTMIIFTVLLLGLSAFFFYIAIHAHRKQRRAAEYKEQQIIAEKERIRRIAEDKAKEEQAKRDREKRIFDDTLKAFSAVDVDDAWDPAVHYEDGQQTRMIRANDESISVICYDPSYKVAKIRGKSGNYYITSILGCSCLDYKKRRLPCKHMYYFANRIKGNVNQEIRDIQHKTLYGLNIVVAGRFAGGRDGIRKRINDLEGIWHDKLDENASLLVCGNAPSTEKIAWFESYHLPVLQDGDLESLFNFDAAE